jgi:magnesium-transporting ATPase (P-type)
MIKEVLVHLSVCHTVIKETDNNSQERYNGPSPDEVALVHAAKRLGVEFIQKDMRNIITINV